MAENETVVNETPAKPVDITLILTDRVEEILDPNMDPIAKIGKMARLCYRTEPKEGEDENAVNERVIKHCLVSGHESVLEHGAFSVYLPIDEVADSWKITEKLTGAKGHRVSFRQVWERMATDTQKKYTYPFMDTDIVKRHEERYHLTHPEGAPVALPVVLANAHAWRLTLRERMARAVQIEHDPLSLLVSLRVLQALNTAAPVLFSDIVAETAELFKDAKPNSKDPIDMFFLNKLTEEERNLDGAIKHFFDNPDDIMAEPACASATFSYILTTDRALTHQHVRHRRDVAYSQESQRYVNYDKKGYRVIPPTVEPAKKWADRKLIDDYDLGRLTKECNLFQAWHKAVEASFRGYAELVNMDCYGDTGGNDAEPLRLPPETCRGALPNDAATRLGVTWITPGGFSNFLFWRMDSHAQYSIRSTMARAVVKALEMQHPYFKTIDPGAMIGWLKGMIEQKLFHDGETRIAPLIKGEEEFQGQIIEYIHAREKQIVELRAKAEKEAREAAEKAAKDPNALPPGAPKIIKVGGSGPAPEAPKEVPTNPPSVSFPKEAAPEAKPETPAV